MIVGKQTIQGFNFGAQKALTVTSDKKAALYARCVSSSKSKFGKNLRVAIVIFNLIFALQIL